MPRATKCYARSCWRLPIASSAWLSTIGTLKTRMRLAASRPSGRLANATAESPERDSTLGLCRIIIGLRTERPIRMVDKLGEPPLAPWRELTLGGYLRAHRSGLRWGGPPRPPRYLPMQAKRAPL